MGSSAMIGFGFKVAPGRCRPAEAGRRKTRGNVIHHTAAETSGAPMSSTALFPSSLSPAFLLRILRLGDDLTNSHAGIDR